jgi:hypothetical protein
MVRVPIDMAMVTMKTRAAKDQNLWIVNAVVNRSREDRFS